jgi:hypothetical protein
MRFLANMKDAGKVINLSGRNCIRFVTFVIIEMFNITSDGIIVRKKFIIIRAQFLK